MRDWIDLTRPMTAGMPVYRAPGYADPPFAAERWSRVEREGFAVWRLSLGTQTGTHIDAPNHFRTGAPTLDALAPADCVGRYFHLSPAVLAGDAVPPGYAGQRLLFLDASPGIAAAPALLSRLIALPAPVWIMAGSLTAEDPDPFWLNRALADAGRFLVEDLDPGALPRVTPRGEAIALPLRLAGLTGSPARVLVRNTG